MSFVFITGNWPNSLLTRYYQIVIVPIYAPLKVVTDEERLPWRVSQDVEKSPGHGNVVDSRRENKDNWLELTPTL